MVYSDVKAAILVERILKGEKIRSVDKPRVAKLIAKRFLEAVRKTKECFSNDGESLFFYPYGIEASRAYKALYKIGMLNAKLKRIAREFVYFLMLNCPEKKAASIIANFVECGIVDDRIKLFLMESLLSWDE